MITKKRITILPWRSLNADYKECRCRKRREAGDGVKEIPNEKQPDAKKRREMEAGTRA